MLEIKLSEAGKRYQYEWIFKNLSLHIPSRAKIAITGSNGSGKSTFLKCLSGQIPFTEGKGAYSFNEKPVQESDIYKLLTISAPYLELPEEYTLKELLDFHFKFKNVVSGLDIQEISKIMYLETSLNKQILYFSSGMKQRLKLGLCFFSDVPLLLLDEPVSNLDQKGIAWYLDLIQNYGTDKTIFICSNDPREYSFCDQILHIENYKAKSLL
ncbi:MAG: ATP-binding cassette domain-containing protein [Anditalea sp.]